MDHPLTIVGLEAENVKRLKAIMIHPAAVGLVKICGQNAAGKSSVLDAIEAALSSKRAEPEMPIRTGETSAKVVLDLGEFRVVRSWTDKGSYLSVHRQDGKLAKPRDFLDKLIGTGLGFDPLAFANQEPVIQVARLLDLLKLPEDPRLLDERKAELYANRRDVNRHIKSLQAQAAGLPGPNDQIPRELVSVESLLSEHAAMTKAKARNDSLRQEVVAIQDRMRRCDEGIAGIVAELERARAQRVDIGEHLMRAEEAAAAIQEPDLAGVMEKIRTAESVNAKVREVQRYDDLAEVILGKEMEATGLTGQIDALDAKKLRILSEAPFPVPGLGFTEIQGEYRVTFNGIPLAECASSERLRVGMAIAMATNPTVRVILIREGSLLDQASLAAVQDAATTNGYQVWVEIVGEDGADAFVIQDGGLLKAPEDQP